MLDRIEAQRKLGTERFRNGTTLLDFNLLDFWQWSSSDLVSNALRGRVAEFLVARALGASDGIRNEWDSYDLRSLSGLRIEVKSAAYLQTWAQRVESAISFDIRPTLAWDANTNEFAPEEGRRRQADLYVFALLAHRQKVTLEPMDVSQWEFYLLASSLLDVHCKNQKQISLAALLRLEPHHCHFDELQARVVELAASIDLPKK
jgi:hypothetical protein